MTTMLCETSGMPIAAMIHNDQNVLILTKNNKQLGFAINSSVSFLVLITFVLSLNVSVQRWTVHINILYQASVLVLQIGLETLLWFVVFLPPVWYSTWSGVQGWRVCEKGSVHLSPIGLLGCLLSHEYIFSCLLHTCPLDICAILMYSHQFRHLKVCNTSSSNECFIVKVCSLWRIRNDFIHVGGL